MVSNVYGITCAAEPMSGLGASVTDRRAAALAKRTQRKAAVQAKRALRIAGRNVKVDPKSVGAANSINSSIQALMTESKAAISNVSNAAGRLRAANLQARTQRARTQTAAQKAAIVGAKAAIARVKGTSAKIRAAGGLQANTVTPRSITPVRNARLRGLGVIDPNTGIDDGTGDPTMDPSFTDPNAGIYPPSQQYYPPPYQDPSVYPGQYPGGSVLPSAGIDPTGLTAGFGMPFGMPNNLTAPVGCRTGSNLPRCLIFEMAQQDRQQFMFIFTVLQQMYAQLLQIVQQLMQELQTAQQQPAPYYGPGQPPYGQPPYGDPYGQQYGYGGASPYGQPPYGYGSQYSTGGDSSVIPPGYDGGGGGDIGIPSDITQVFPGPRGPMSPSPDQSQPNIISSDSLPDGAGPSTSDVPGGGDDAPVPSFTPVRSSAAATLPLIPQSGQSASAGPNQPYIIVQQQAPGQASYADASLPANSTQDQPQLEVPSDLENWARDE